jgi:putative aldouronate transport system permease protein
MVFQMQTAESRQISKQTTRQLNKALANKKRVKVFTKENIILYLMFLPVIAYYLVFCYAPMSGIALAFADYRISGFKKWVGFENFEYLFNLKYFWEAFKNTWLYIGINYLFGFPAPIILALLLNEIRVNKFKKLVQTVSSLPHFVSWVVVGGIWVSLLSPSTGYVNFVIQALGGESIFFMSREDMFPAVFQFIRIWKDVGYSAILYLAALASIDVSLYEAAKIDGAGRFRQVLYITLPGIKETILIIFVLSFTGVLNLFEPLYVMTNPMIEAAAEVLDTYTYKIGVVQGRYPVGVAIGLFKSVIAFVLVMMTNYFSKKLTENGDSIL